MAFKMVRTELEGYPVLYREYLVKELNKIINEIGSITNQYLREIGRAVSSFVKHTMDNKTRDGYTWLGSLEYKINDAKIIILFPWHQDFKNPESKMDRSINVYSNKKLPDKEVKNLLEHIVYNAKQFFKRK